jgi:lipopolysaccharide export system protein LptA
MGFMSMSGLEMTKLAAVAALTLALALAGPAAAQIAGGSDAPVDITADALEVVNNQCMSIWSGSADVIKTFSKKGAGKPTGGQAACGALDRMEAIGNVYYVTPQQKVRGDNAVYDVSAERIVITGDVVAVSGQNVIRGSRLVVNSNTGDAQMESGAKGPGKARPRAVIYPNQQAGQTASRR